jgi:hypothetical protein
MKMHSALAAAACLSLAGCLGDIQARINESYDAPVRARAERRAEQDRQYQNRQRLLDWYMDNWRLRCLPLRLSKSDICDVELQKKYHDVEKEWGLPYQSLNVGSSSPPPMPPPPMQPITQTDCSFIFGQLSCISW